LYACGNKFKTIDVSAIACNELWYPPGDEEVSQGYKVTLDYENKLLIYENPEPTPEKKPDKTIKVGKKLTFKTKKKIGEVIVSDEEVASVQKKGKKVIVKGLSEGTVTVTAYDKKGEEIKSWVVKVE
jgi:Flp pilus assembly secretin CpaC